MPCLPSLRPARSILLAVTVASLILVLPAPPAAAADVTFTVDTFDDDLSADCDGTNGCSLRGAVLAANALGGDGTVETIEIVLGAGTYALDLDPANSTDPDGGSLILDNDEDEIEIRGAGMEGTGIEIGADVDDRVILVSGGAHRLTELGVYGGDIVGRGGGIFVDGASSGLTLSELTVSGNEASDGGGGIAVNDGSLVVEATVVRTNTSQFVGGGIHADDATVTIRDARIGQNEADRRGGGIFAEGDTTLVLDRSSLIANRLTDEFSGEGAGLHLRDAGATATVTATTFADNLFDSPGLDAEGSQIWVGDATLELTGVTLLASELVDAGADAGTNTSNARVPLYLSSAPPVTVEGTIIDVAPSASGEGSDDACGSAFGSAFNNATSLGGNVFSSDCPLFDGGAGDVQADPLLDSLTTTGLQRWATPQAGSSAIGNWTGCGAGLVDQRGLARPAGDCTSGAIEVASAGTPPTADPGGPYTVEEGSTVMLDGSGSSDAEGPVTFAWSVGAGSLNDPSAEQPTFDAAGVAPGTVTVQLTVTDDDGNVATASTTVEVLAVDGAAPGTDGGPEDPPSGDAADDGGAVTEIDDGDSDGSAATLPDTGSGVVPALVAALLAVLLGITLVRPWSQRAET